MDALKDIWASLVSGVQERTTNPLSFSFLGSWCIWNYKFLVILFGDGTAAQRLNAIEGMYPHTASTLGGGALLYPLLTALAYVFLYPFVSAMAIKFYREKQVEIANSIKGLEEKKLLTVEEATKLTRRHEAQRKKWEESEIAFETQLSEIREALAAAEKQALELKTSKSLESASLEELRAAGSEKEAEVENSSDTSPFPNEVFPVSDNSPEVKELSKVMVNLLLKISDSPTGLSASQLSTSTSENFTVIEVNLEEMRQHALLKKSDTGRWLLTPKGKSIAVNILGNLRR